VLKYAQFCINVIISYTKRMIYVSVGQIYCATVRKVITKLELSETVLVDAPCR